MNDKEALLCVADLSEVYPNDRWSEDRLRNWIDLFVTELPDYEIARKAIRSWVLNKTGPPAFADIREGYMQQRRAQKALETTKALPGGEPTPKEMKAQAKRVRELIAKSGIKSP